MCSSSNHDYKVNEHKRNTIQRPRRQHGEPLSAFNLTSDIANILLRAKNLCRAALQFSMDTLKIGGHFVCKFYQGIEDKAFEYELKAAFSHVFREKPDASRSVSNCPVLVSCGT